jgi:flagellar motility protein MotE (MotC chaperone)
MALEQEVEAQYEALRLLQEDLSAKLKAKEAATPPPPKPDELDKQAARLKEREANVQQLARVFEKMKPPEAAKVVPQMEEDLAVEVLARLKERQAAKILGGIDPELAGRLSKKLVERRKRELAERK